MTIRRLTTLCLAASLLTFTAASRAGAATITAVATFSLPGASTGTLGPVGNTPAPNNDDDPAASPNVIPYSVFLNSPGSLETAFELQDSGGTTEYRFTQAFINAPGAPWIGFRFELGFGIGENFVLAAPENALQFDTLNGQSTATSPQFTLQFQQPQQLDWSVAAAPFAAQFVFAIDVPDGLARANPSGVNRFTLRQTPLVASAVPEPAAFSLAGVALLCVMLRRHINQSAQ